MTFEPAQREQTSIVRIGSAGVLSQSPTNLRQMTEPALVALLIVAVVALIAVAVRAGAYRITHPYTEADLRQRAKDSVLTSRLTRGGQAADQLAPLLPAFYEQFNPKDARFLGGGPIDFVIFDGLDEGDLRRVVFLDIKTGAADLNPRQRQVKRAVMSGEVDFEVLHLPRAN